MNDTILIALGVTAAFIGLIALLAWAGIRNKQARVAEREKRARFIADYRFPAQLTRRLAARFPHLRGEQLALVLDGLRQYFLACLGAQAGAIARGCGMPSKAVDEAWHEFILMTRDYEAFCQGAFGKYLHHTPDSKGKEPADNALANTLHQLRGPSVAAPGWAMLGAMPLLFAIDRELGIAGGQMHDAGSLEALDRQRWLLAQHAQGSAMGGVDSSHGDDRGSRATWDTGSGYDGGSYDGGGGGGGGDGGGGGGGCSSS